MNRPYLKTAFAVILLFTCAIAAAQENTFPYQRAPKYINDVLDAPAPPTMSVNPTRDFAILTQSARYPSIAELSQPVLRLAGLRMNPATNGPQRLPRVLEMRVMRLADGKETKVTLPNGGYVGAPSWSPDGKSFFFISATASSIEAYVGATETGAVKKLPGIAVNAMFGSGCAWMPDSKSLICRLIPAGRGAAPQRSQVPVGPNVQEASGRAGDVPTFQDLLKNPHDEALFDYYATSQLALVNASSGKVTPIGKPAIIGTNDVSPDGKYILVETVHRPYSYQVTLGSFPSEMDVWDLAGKQVFHIASVPLLDNLPNGGVPTGPRNISWRSTDPATLVWVEALDEGNPRNKVPHRDRIVWLKAPFKDKPAEIIKTQYRASGLTWGESGNFAILREFDRDRNWLRTWFLNPSQPDQAKLVWDMSSRERYKNPGTQVMRRLPNGETAIMQDGDYIYLTGAGSTPEGDRPFLRRFNTQTLKEEELFRCDDKSYETYTAMLKPGPAGEPMFITRHESPTEPPNYRIRKAGSAEIVRALTNTPDPTPQLRAIKKELVKYKRADGVDLSFTMYLPPDYKPGERRPAVVWAYPLEYTDPSVAGQVGGSTNRFNTFTGISHLFYTLAGYVVLDDATMPVVGDPVTANNTFVEQIVSSAKAAIDKAADMGVIDPNRVGVGGHSYGAFMTANLLAHSDNLFRAGVARSGAYNRTLTPFGFQSERRSVWAATDIYMKLSPFLHAHKIKEPILLIHGEMDNNSGTFPIQSERMYAAIRGNGGNVRYVTLPYESHGYAARESVEHTLWEMITWFDKHVKNAAAPQQAATDGARK